MAHVAPSPQPPSTESLLIFPTYVAAQCLLPIFWIFLEFKTFPALVRKAWSLLLPQATSPTQTLKIFTHTCSHDQANSYI